MIWEELGIDAAEREKIEEREAGELPEQGDLFAVFGRENWRRTALGVFLMGMQQASAIDGVLYVSFGSIFTCDGEHVGRLKDWVLMEAVRTSPFC